MPKYKMGDKFSCIYDNEADTPDQKQRFEEVRRDIDNKRGNRCILEQNMCLPEHKYRQYPHGCTGAGAEISAENRKEEDEQQKINADHNHYIQGQR